MSRITLSGIYTPVIQSSRLREKNRGKEAMWDKRNFGCRARGEYFISGHPAGEGPGERTARGRGLITASS
jgi:hypothetical protein